jgi:hypothetical protein
MSRRQLLGLVFGVVSCLQTQGIPVLGQQIQRYRPATPTVSPYLNLLRTNDFGGLPNYYSLVRPQLQQQAINRQLQVSNQQQSAALSALSQQAQTGVSPTGKASQFMWPGSQPAFQNTSRYYPPAQAIRRR